MFFYSALLLVLSASLFFFNDAAPTEIYTLSLHDALPICWFFGSHWPNSSRKLKKRSLARAFSSSRRAPPEAAAEPSSAVASGSPVGGLLLRPLRRPPKKEKKTLDLHSLLNIVAVFLFQNK